MGLFSFFRKDRQQSSARDSDFYSRADEEQTGRSKRKGKRDEPVDPVLPEKKRARRRLVGAVALVLAAVIGLPMILDSEPKPLSDDISIQIPSKDTQEQQTSKVESKPVGSSSNAIEQSALSEGEEVVQQAPAARTTEKPLESSRQAVKPIAPGSVPASAAAPSVTPTPIKPPVTAKAEPVPAAKLPQPPVIDKNDHSAEAARARAILEGRSATAPQPAVTANSGGAGKISLQVAALASQDKVNELQKKLQEGGLKSYTQKVSTASGDRIRVRVGPFANEAEAEKARAKLTGMGLTGTMTAH